MAELIEKSIDHFKLDDKTLELLLKEYDRMTQRRQANFEYYQRRFDIYIGAALAAFAGTVALRQYVTSPLQEPLILSILLAMLILGFAIFASLCYLNASIVHHERAIRLIQKYFIEREPAVSYYLYYTQPRGILAGIEFRTILARGLTGGSPKSILTLANSTLLAFFAVRLFNWLNFISPTIISSGIVGFVVFVLSCLLHVVYTRWIYIISGIKGSL